MAPPLQWEVGSDYYWSLPFYWGWLERVRTHTHADVSQSYFTTQFVLAPSLLRLMTRGLVCPLLFVKCTYRTYSMLLKILPFTLHTNPLQVQALQSRSCLSYLAYATTPTWTVASLAAAKFKSQILCVWLFLVLCFEHGHSHDFVWLLLVGCTVLLFNHLHTEGWKPCANRGPAYELENFQRYGEPCFAVAAISKGGCLPQIPRRDKLKSLLT
jgi:hypothetical protein